MRTLAFIRFFWRQAPGAFSISVFLVVLNSALDAATVLSLVPVMDYSVRPDLENASQVTRKISALLVESGFPVSLIGFLTLFWALAALSSGVAICAAYWQVRAKYKINSELFVATPQDFFSARWEFFSSKSKGKLINTLGQELAHVGDAFFCVVALVTDTFVVAINLIIPFYLSWQVTSISVLAAGAMLVPFMLLGRFSYRLGKAKVASANRLVSFTQEVLSLAKLVLGFGNQEETLRQLSEHYEFYRRAHVRSHFLSGAIPHTYRAVSFLVLGLTLYAASQLNVFLSEAAIILISLYQTLPRLGSIATNRNNLESFSFSFEQIEELRQEARAMRNTGGKRIFAGFRGALALRGVTFAYPGCPPVLHNIELLVPKGTMVAVVGPSGVGKSTLIDLLMGFHRPSAGEIQVDGVALQEFDLSSYRKRIGYVPQESALFDTSIRNNLLWAKEDATEEEIKRACEQANAVEFIEQLPEKYETVVGDRGTRLSGGQIQRVALARAILRKPELLVLDEATSSLDSTSERLIQQAIEAIAKDTTVIVIAHRLSTVRNADQIVVLQGGRVVEQDIYETLVTTGGHFSRMVQAQMLLNHTTPAIP